MNRAPWLIFGLIWILYPLELQSQTQTADCGCNAALAKDMTSTLQTDVQQYAFLDMIDKDKFEEYKHDASATATIPIAKALIDASASYSDFDQKRTHYFHQVGYTANRDQEYRQLQIVTSAVAYPYWGKCMSECSAHQIGLFVWKEHEDKDDVVCHVTYHGAPGAGSAKLSGVLQGGSAVGASPGNVFPRGKTIDSNGNTTVIISRSPRKIVIASLEAAGFSTELISEWKDAESVEGTLKLFVPSKLESPDQPKCEWSDWTDNNNNAQCSQTTCSPDGQWNATIRTVTVQAPPDHILRNAHWSGCRSRIFVLFGGGSQPAVDNGPGCENWWTSESLTVGVGETTATAVFRAWSHSTQRQVCTDTYRITTQTSVQPIPVKMPLASGGTFTIQVPDGVGGAALEYTINGNSAALNPGEKVSADNLFELKGSFKEGPVTYYMYAKR